MAGIFCITIDTEPDCDVHWKRSRPLTFESVTFGIPSILRPIWDKFGIRPVYFVSPEVVENDECCRTLKDEIARGAEIGTHLHSEYIEPQRKHEDISGTASDEFPCFAYDAEIESAKIKNLTGLIEKKLGVRPVSYRAARYGADLDTIKALEKLGYKVDSSVTPGYGLAVRAAPTIRGRQSSRILFPKRIIIRRATAQFWKCLLLFRARDCRFCPAGGCFIAGCGLRI